VKLVVVTEPPTKDRRTMLGSGIGKIWMSEDAFSPETDREIQQMFEEGDPELDNY
jgi:hypothetical protein